MREQGDIEVLCPSSQELALLRRKFERLGEVTSFSECPELAAEIASHGIRREIGGPNDELARFIFNAEKGRPVALNSLQGELIRWRRLIGVRIHSTESNRLELRTRGFFDVVHPDLSGNGDGTYHSLVIFPEILAKIAQAHGVDLVIVKSWGWNTIFGRFDSSKGYYQTNFWELKSNDVLKFADLVRQGRLALLGTHDVIAHVGGVAKEPWRLLRQDAENVYQSIRSYFSTVGDPSVASLILPYTIGVVLDDLAQPPSYGSASHRFVLNALLERLERREIAADLPVLLSEFPPSFQRIIELSRTPGIETRATDVERAFDELIREIQNASLLGA
jgi:hypothetical protein